MKVGSLFSGIGGFDLGFERVGMETVWFLGNALVPQIAEWIGGRLMEYERA